MLNKGNYRKEIVSSATWMMLTLILFSFFGTIEAKSRKIDSLLKVLAVSKEDTNKVNVLNLLSNLYWKSGGYEEGLEKAKAANVLAEKLNFRVGVASALNNAGIIFTLQGLYPKALDSYKKALDIFQKMNHKKGIANALLNIGIVNERQGNYPDALNGYFSSLKIREEMGDKLGIAAAYSNIGNIYWYQHNYTDALKNYNSSFAIRKSMGDEKACADVLSNVANVFFDQGKLEKNTQKREQLLSEALKNHAEVLRIDEKAGDIYNLANEYDNIGGILSFQGKYDDAIKNHLIAFGMRKEIKDQEGLCTSFINLGSDRINLKKYKEAERDLQNGLQLGKEIGSKDAIKECCRNLAVADSAVGNFKGAYENYVAYIQYSDTLLNEANTKKTIQVQMQYEFDKKESMQKAEQEKKDALQRKNAVRQKVILLVIIIFVISGLIFIVFVYRSLRESKRKNKIIQTQKHLVEEKQKEILDSIRYAKHIQQALLPTEKYIAKTLSRLNKN